MAKVVTENFRIESTNEFVKSFRTSNDKVVQQFEDGLEVYNDGLPSLANWDPQNPGDSDGPELTDNQIDSITNLARININTILPENNYYIVGSSVSNTVDVTNTQQQKREFQKRIIFGNKINDADIRYMFALNPWVSETVYDQFDDTADMSTKNFFVTILDGDVNETSYKVFKCVSNNGGGQSTVKPSTSNLDVLFETTSEDGYVWKFMFSVPPSEYLLFATSRFLPFIEDPIVKAGAVQGISNVAIDNTNFGTFADYLIGDKSDGSTKPSTGLIEQVIQDSAPDNTWKLTVGSQNVVKSTLGAYRNMYLRITSTGELFEILNSDVPSTEGLDLTQNKNLIVFVKTTTDITGRAGAECEIVPKITISKSDTGGTDAIAYGTVDINGTLTGINFQEKGSGYFDASASLAVPPALEDRAEGNDLRVILSPVGGHGSNPVLELFMSHVSLMTNFYADEITNIPGTGSYTKVGLIKNPTFRDGTFPNDFDNRVKITCAGDVSPSFAQGYYVFQTSEDGQVVEGNVHEVKYDADNTQTYIYVIDSIGPYNAQFTAVRAEDTVNNITAYSGEFQVKTSRTIGDSQTFVINNVEQEKYTPYSGQVMHFVNFDAITRTGIRKEKVKLIFDF
jgi:hypothetical protein